MSNELLRVRIGTTISCAFPVLTRGQATSLEGRNITLLLVSPDGNKEQTRFTVTGEDENIVNFTIEGSEQTETGLYRIEVYENYRRNAQTVADADAFILVPLTEMENDNIEGISTAETELPAVNIAYVGRDGYTPYIEDDYWYINGQSTGVRASADDGATPFIGDNNHWWIGSTDTGIKVDYSEEESARVTAEGERAAAELLRAGAETERSDAESARANAETARSGAEATRIEAEASRDRAEDVRRLQEEQRDSHEQYRNGNETTREAAEADRVASENARIAAEEARQAAESSRANAATSSAAAESARKSAETARQSAETTRGEAEQAREANEALRQSAETARDGAESDRADAEAARVLAEQGRVTAEGLREAAETARGTAYTAAEAARDGLYQAAETARGTAYTTAEGLRDDAFDAKEATRDAANAAALAAAETLSALGHKFGDYKKALALVNDTTYQNEIPINGKSGDVYYCKWNVDASIISSYIILINPGATQLSSTAVPNVWKKVTLPSDATSIIAYKYKTLFSGSDNGASFEVVSEKGYYNRVQKIEEGDVTRDSQILSLRTAVGEYKGSYDLIANTSVYAGTYVIPVKIKAGDTFGVKFTADSTKCTGISAFYSCDENGDNRTSLGYNTINEYQTFVAEANIDYVTFYIINTKILANTTLTLLVDAGIKGDISGIKEKIEDIESDVSDIEGDISDIQDSIVGIGNDISDIQESADSLESRINKVDGEIINVSFEQGGYTNGVPKYSSADRVRINRIIKKSELPLKVVVPNDANVRIYGYNLYSEDDDYTTFVSWNSVSSTNYKVIEFTSDSLGNNNGLSVVFANSTSLSAAITPSDCASVSFIHKDGKIHKIEQKIEQEVEMLQDSISSIPVEEGNAIYYGRKQTLKITDEEHKLTSELVVEHIHSSYPYTTHNQSMAVWDGKCFCFNDTSYASDGFCIVIDAESGNVLDRVTDVPTVFTANGDGVSHLNNACFTDQYLSHDDVYPLILLSRGDYSSATNQNGKKMYVFRVTENGGSFGFTLIKTIIADHNFLATFNPSWVYDAKRKMIWGYCSTEDWRWIDFRNQDYRKFKGVNAKFKAYGASYVCVESGEQAAVSANITIVVADVSRTISVSQGDTISEVFAYTENAGGTCVINCSQDADAFTGLYYVYRCDSNGDNKQLIIAQNAIVGFKAPDLCDSTTVTISNAEFTEPSYIDTGTYQGGCCANGKLYLPFHDYQTINGNPTSYIRNVCLIVEPISGYIESMICLSTNREPEGCAIYNGELYISHHIGGATDETTSPSFEIYKYSFD